MGATLRCDSCNEFTELAQCPNCGEVGALREVTGVALVDEHTPPALKELLEITRDVIRRLDDVIGVLPRPSEIHSVALLAKDQAKRATRWIGELVKRARLSGEQNQ